MNHVIRFAFAAVTACALAACMQPTSFTGAPKVPSGATGCRAMCSAQGMELAGMVFMGEYSDGCICTLPGAPAAPGAAPGAAAAQAAAVGVRIQMTEAEEERQRQDDDDRRRRQQ